MPHNDTNHSESLGNSENVAYATPSVSGNDRKAYLQIITPSIEKSEGLHGTPMANGCKQMKSSHSTQSAITNGTFNMPHHLTIRIEGVALKSVHVQVSLVKQVHLKMVLS